VNQTTRNPAPIHILHEGPESVLVGHACTCLFTYCTQNSDIASLIDTWDKSVDVL
jgi:hypothetical protein